jgi:hypothetical protein
MMVQHPRAISKPRTRLAAHRDSTTSSTRGRHPLNQMRIFGMNVLN